MSGRSNAGDGGSALRVRTALGAAAGLLFGLAAGAPAQDRFADAEIGTVQVTEKIHMLTGPGGNIGVSVGEDGTLLVDDKYAPLTDRVRAALERLGPGNVKFVLNTHCHGDHTGGNEVFGRAAPIIAHANVRRRLATAGGCGEEAAPEGALPVITFGDSLSVHFNGEELRVIHLHHAHTDGDAVIFFTGSNAVHTGDLFFNGRFPYVDLGAGGTVRGMIRGVEKVISQVPEDAAVIPGHGPLAGVEDLRRYLEMLRETEEIVRDRRERGMGLEEAKAAGLPAEWEEWSWGFISTSRWIETIYRSPGG